MMHGRIAAFVIALSMASSTASAAVIYTIPTTTLFEGADSVELSGIIELKAVTSDPVAYPADYNGLNIVVAGSAPTETHTFTLANTVLDSDVSVVGNQITRSGVQSGLRVTDATVGAARQVFWQDANVLQVSINGRDFTGTYAGGVIAVIPEPSAFLLLLLSGCFVGVRFQRQR